MKMTEPDKSFASVADECGCRRLSKDGLPLDEGTPDKRNTHMDTDPDTANYIVARLRTAFVRQKQMFNIKSIMAFRSAQEHTS